MVYPSRYCKDIPRHPPPGWRITIPRPQGRLAPAKMACSRSSTRGKGPACLRRQRGHAEQGIYEQQRRNSGEARRGPRDAPTRQQKHLKHLQVSYLSSIFSCHTQLKWDTRVCVRADKHTHTHIHTRTHTWKHMPDCTQTHTHSGADTGKRTRMKKRTQTVTC